MTQEALNAERRARLALEQRVGELQSRVRQQWAYPPQAPSVNLYRQILIGYSNTLATISGIDYKGIKASASLTSVPTLAPTSISATYSNGLCAAYDLGTDPSATTGPLVWITSASTVTVQNPAGGADITVTNPFQYQVTSGSIALSVGSLRVPIATGGYATVYQINFVG